MNSREAYKAIGEAFRRMPWGSMRLPDALARLEVLAGQYEVAVTQSMRETVTHWHHAARKRVLPLAREKAKRNAIRKAKARAAFTGALRHGN